ncbi:hypothetical protein Acr_03g0002270 [Actinidia rufa]|uniref:GATA-type transcription activator N-terminal domain-containing protein n=1 Tax=Actinidia rufa TaxID=165716 RepID=A0A7J0EAG9_9ERIC|nr:hypothetical protein Acr_03g0002270 [Actinidia rufa]
MGGLRALSWSPSQNGLFPNSVVNQKYLAKHGVKKMAQFRVSAKAEEKEDDPKKKDKQSLFGMVTEALDFSQVRSDEDAQLLQEARDATKSGGKMNKEQYGALRRKIGGTYKDFFKSYIDVDGQYVEEGWVDKTCKVCKKDTRGEPRQVDKLGRYVHVACAEKADSGNFFTRLFSR